MVPSVLSYLLRWPRCFTDFGIWMLLISGLGGCGYHLVGTGSGLAPTARSIAIPILENKSQEAGIEQEITSAIRESFLADGRLRFASRSEADLLLLGTVLRYALVPLSFNRDDFVQEYRIEVELEITLIAQANQQVLLQQEINPAQDDYLVKADIIPTEVARKLAQQRAFHQLGNQILSLIVDGF